MLKAEYECGTTLEKYQVEYPEMPRVVTRLGHRPSKCTFTGEYHKADMVMVISWMRQCIAALKPGGEVVEDIVQIGGEYPVDKQGIMRFFEYGHLPEQLQEISAPICDLAVKLNENTPDGAEKSAGLRKLLEAKDCFVRASFDK